MSLRFASGAAADFGDYLENIARERGEEAALRESRRVLAELVRLAGLGVTGRQVRIEGQQTTVYRWFVRPFVVYYVRTDDITVLRLFHARREPIER